MHLGPGPRNSNHAFPDPARGRNSNQLHMRMHWQGSAAAPQASQRRRHDSRCAHPLVLNPSVQFQASGPRPIHRSDRTRSWLTSALRSYSIVQSLEVIFIKNARRTGGFKFLRVSWCRPCWLRPAHATCTCWPARGTRARSAGASWRRPRQAAASSPGPAAAGRLRHTRARTAHAYYGSWGAQSDARVGGPWCAWFGEPSATTLVCSLCTMPLCCCCFIFVKNTYRAGTVDARACAAVRAVPPCHARQFGGGGERPAPAPVV